MGALARVVRCCLEGMDSSGQELVVSMVELFLQVKAERRSLLSADYQELLRIFQRHQGAKGIASAVVAVAAFDPSSAADWIETALGFVAETNDVVHGNYWEVSRCVVLGSFRAANWLDQHCRESAIRRRYSEQLLSSLGDILFNGQMVGGLPRVDVSSPAWQKQLAESIRAYVSGGGERCLEQVRYCLVQWSKRWEERLPGEFGEFVANELFYGLVSQLKTGARLSLLAEPS